MVTTIYEIEENGKNKFQNTIKWFLKIMGPPQVNCSSTRESKNEEKNLKN